jgi:hypothetical protein
MVERFPFKKLMLVRFHLRLEYKRGEKSFDSIAYTMEEKSFDLLSVAVLSWHYVGVLKESEKSLLVR